MFTKNVTHVERRGDGGITRTRHKHASPGIAHPTVHTRTSVTDPDTHKDMPPGSGSTWTDADPDPGGKKT